MIDPPGDTRDRSIRKYHVMNVNMIIMFPFSIILGKAGNQNVKQPRVRVRNLK